MKIASFFGFSATKLILLRLEKDDFEMYVRSLNNKADMYILKSLKSELALLDFALDRLKFSYVDKESRKLEGKLKANKRAIDRGEVPKLTEQEVKDIEDKLLTEQKSVSSQQMSLKGEVIGLSTVQIKILNKLMENRFRIDQYLGNISENAVNEKEIFGKDINKVLAMTKPGLLYNLQESIKPYLGSKAIKANIYKKYSEDVEYLLNIDSESERIENNISEIENDFKSRKLSLKEVDNLNEFRREFGAVNSRIVDDKNVLNMVTKALYKLETFDENYLSLILDLEEENISKEEYFEEFKGLQQLLIVGLDFYNREMFRNSLGSMLFAGSIKKSFNPETKGELYEAVLLVKRALDSKMSISEKLGGNWNGK